MESVKVSLLFLDSSLTSLGKCEDEMKGRCPGALTTASEVTWLVRRDLGPVPLTYGP